ncbi:MAG: 16S rRNA (adenine(1518)-N(6)/adenine(1519)-N(6))-dimethyltransferase RsmA [Ruminococcaceae bacterium]|nr:16S rRNA (adenine(1518)-N(6)/adenine(1519)-N(6))-dimethyltransferase RsmA [Oscillospiraceae bacterium]
MDLCNLSVIKSVMADAGITFRKDFGQNFLTNRIIPEDIADNCADSSERMILEIGPGIGCLTQELAMRYKKVVAVEIDKGLIPVLSKTLADFDNITVINEDIMKVDIAALIAEHSEGMPVSVCANLPYYITTPILMHLLESGVKFSTITVMVQNEVAARLAAKPGSSDYGAITAVLAYYGSVRKLFKVSAGCFIPAPKVDSAVVRIDLYDKCPYDIKDETLFRGCIRAAFEMRRKTLENALCAGLGKFTKEQIAAAISRCGFDSKIRGERLSCEDFANLSNALFEMNKTAKI